MTEKPTNGRTHEPNLREITANLDGLRDIMDERHTLYTERAESLKAATEQARTALEKQTTLAFASAEKAIDKAETAQRLYNERSNEFRAALDDAQKTLLSKESADREFNRIGERIEDVRGRVEALELAVGRSSGAMRGAANLWGYIAGAIGVAALIVSLVRGG